MWRGTGVAEASAAEVTCSSEEGQVGTTDGLDSPDSPVWGLNGTKLLGGSQDKNSKRGKTNESGAEAETNEGIGVLGVQRKGESPAAIFCITEVFLCPKSARRGLQES